MKERDSGFKVTDRRSFTSEGELRDDASQEETAEFPAITDENSPPKPKPQPAPTEPPINPEPQTGVDEMLSTPTEAEQKAQADAYKRSSKAMDSEAERGGVSAQDLQITFERYMASLYMSAMIHMGLMHEQGGQPRIDIIGARQTIDTLTLLAEKTKGNLTPQEERFLQNCLYELRMAYVEVTNALARGPQPAQATGTRR